MPEAPSIKEVLGRIQGQIADLQGEHEVMAGPFDASKWKIDVSVADLQALVSTLQPEGERQEAIARLRRSLDQWAGCSPGAISKGSEAQMAYFVADAKHDIALLASGLVQDEAGIRADEREKCAEIADLRYEPVATEIAAAIRSARDGGEDR